MGDKRSKKTPSFEVAMERLETIVHALESGDIPLEQLVKTYKEGLAYREICRSHLDRAALLLKRLNNDGAEENLPVQETGEA